MIIHETNLLLPAILQKYLDNFDLSIRVIYIMGTLGFSIGIKQSASIMEQHKMNLT